MTVALAGDSVRGSARGFAAQRAPRGEGSSAYPRAARPPEPPGAGGHLDGLGEGEREVMLALDLVWGAVPECGVQPSPVVELLDVLEDRAAGLFVGGERAPAQPFLLQRGEERFLGGVVVGASLAAVGLRDPVCPARGAERH